MGPVHKVFAIIRVFFFVFFFKGRRVEKGARHPNTILKTMFWSDFLMARSKKHQIKWKMRVNKYENSPKPKRDAMVLP